MSVLFSRPKPPNLAPISWNRGYRPAVHSLLSTPALVGQVMFARTAGEVDQAMAIAARCLANVLRYGESELSEHYKDILRQQLAYWEHWSPPTPGKGRPEGSGRFKDAEDFRLTVISGLRAIRQQGIKATQLELARFWYQHDNDPTAEVDSLVAEIKRYCREFGVPWQSLRAAPMAPL